MTTSTRKTLTPMGVTGLALLTLLVGACGTAHAGTARLQSDFGPWAVEVLADGAPAPQFLHRAETYVLGRKGQRYTLRVWNRSSRRIEAVVSVDGRDVVDGRPGDFVGKRGYLVAPGGFVDIDGWRLSNAEVAAFRFSSVDDSYAGRMGNPRNVGVIGVAIFPERHVPPPRPVLPWPQRGRGPADADDGAEGEARGRARESAEGAPSASAPSAGKGAPAADAARSAGAPSRSARRGRPGLGTEFGENVYAPVENVFFVRQDPRHPAAVLGLRYNDRRGLVAMGVDLYPRTSALRDRQLRETADPFPVSTGGYARPPLGWRGR